MILIVIKNKAHLKKYEDKPCLGLWEHTISLGFALVFFFTFSFINELDMLQGLLLVF